MGLTLPNIPGFADVPDLALAAGEFAQGVLLGRIAENANMGMVRPEVFVTQQKHGDTVPLPISTVDGYGYSRDELIYMWGVQSTGAPTTGQPSYPKLLIWFAQWFVNQDTGEVTSEIWYSNDSGKTTQKTNDGTLVVYAIATRRKNSLFLSAAPTYSDVADSEFATDKALHETPLRQLNKNAKFGVVGSEAIYMGTYKSLDVVAAPVSQADGYVYDKTTEVIWLWSWVWTTDGDTYQAPVATVPVFGNLLTQLDRIDAHVEADGTVHTNVGYRYDSYIDMGDQFGRIAVTALCFRGGVSGITSANDFAWFDSTLLGPGDPCRTDLMVQINKNVREAVARPEMFDAGDFNDGDTVPLPTSGIDGYTYTRAECIYLYEMGDTGVIPRPSPYHGNIRLIGWSGSVNQSTGVVSISEIHKKDGGANVTDNNGTLRVKILAFRNSSHTLPVPQVISSDGGDSASNPGSSGNVSNGSFDNFSGGSGQTIGDGWTEVSDAAGTRSYSVEASLSPVGSSQGITVNSGAGNLGGVRTARTQVCPGDRWVLVFRAAASAAITTGFKARLRFWDLDAANSVTADVVSGALGTSVVNQIIGVQIPANGDTNLWTGQATVALSAAPGWTPAWVDLEFVVDAPDVTATVSVDDVDWLLATRNLQGREVDTADPTDGDVFYWDNASKKIKTKTVSGGSGGGGVNAQTGTSYSVVSGDNGKLLTFTNASPIAVAFPNANTLASTFYTEIENRGAGTLTITPTGCTLDGGSALILGPNQGVRIFGDGTNYYCGRGRSSDADLMVSDVTTNNASTAKHGFLQKLPGGTSTFLRGDGAFSAPPGTGGGGVSAYGIANPWSWYDAAQLSGFSDGDQVTQWPDFSGYGRDAVGRKTSTSYPVYKTSILNGKPIVRFSGSNYFGGHWPQTQACFSVFIVFKITSLTPAYTGIVGVVWDSDLGGWFVKSSGKTALYMSSSVYDGTGSATLGTSTFYIMSMIWGPTAIQTRVALANDSSAVALGSGWPDTTRVLFGNQSVAGRLFTGDMAEILTFGRSLSNTDRDTVENALKSKYGL